MLPTPKYFSFVQTNDKKVNKYAINLIFYELCPKETLDIFQRYSKENLKQIYIPKSLCLISLYSFFDSFKNLLTQLYRLHISQLSIPIERIICNFMDEIPLPDKGKIAVEYEIGGKIIQFYRPINEFEPYSSRENFEYLFSALSCENIIKVMEALLLEKKVILLSKRRGLLGHCSFALSSLLFPFQWQFVYIPVK